MQRLWAFLVFVLVSGVSIVAHAQDLVGRWYGEGYQHRRYLHWMADRKADGSFFVEFRHYEDCKLVMQQKEAGRWNLADGVYSTHTVMIDGRIVNYRDSYILESLANEVMTYRHIRTGTQFQAQRVPVETFDWPVCDPSRLVS